MPCTFRDTHCIAACYLYFAPEENPEILFSFGGNETTFAIGWISIKTYIFKLFTNVDVVLTLTRFNFTEKF